ncbi:MAG TPA: hypothetical protein VGY66_17395, partial [Gemmataceae bacterium]|nr:hypothetical protein [Gemmataceae bacterium]
MNASHVQSLARFFSSMAAANPSLPPARHLALPASVAPRRACRAAGRGLQNGYKGLTILEQLDLRNTRVTNEGLRELSSLRDLRRVFVKG